MKGIPGLNYFQFITDKIMNWKYEPLNGISVFTKSERYAHIEINITVTDYYTDNIIWTVDEKYIPLEFRQEIENVFVFFCNYLTALKGSRSNGNLAFEITDGSFNRDSHRKAFSAATIFALGNCFDKQIFEVSPVKLEISQSVKEHIDRANEA